MTDDFDKKHDDENWFDELRKLYPAYVVRPDGCKDYLRVDLTRSCKKYKDIVKKNKGKHDQIMRALSREVYEKTMTNKLGYMMKLPKWLNSEA